MVALEGTDSALPGGPDDRWRYAMPATKKRHRGQPHKVLHLTTYERLEQYLARLPGGISIC